jgi:hypothetical protein
MPSLYYDEYCSESYDYDEEDENPEDIQVDWKKYSTDATIDLLLKKNN